MLNVLRYSQTLALGVLLAAVAALSLLYRNLVVESLVQSETDASVAFTKAFANATWPRHASFVRQARAEGLGATMMVNSAMVNREYWDLAGPGGEGSLMTFTPDPRRLPSAVDVVRRFRAESSRERSKTSFSWTSSLSRLASRLMVACLRSSWIGTPLSPPPRP